MMFLACNRFVPSGLLPLQYISEGFDCPAVDAVAICYACVSPRKIIQVRFACTAVHGSAMMLWSPQLPLPPWHAHSLPYPPYTALMPTTDDWALHARRPLES